MKMKIHTKLVSVLGIILAIGLGGSLLAAPPPHYLNYQGVLRDASGTPQDGSYDMVFRFYDSGSTLLLTDEHTGAGAVTVTGGLFSVRLGGGVVTPGSRADMNEMFAEEWGVFLEIQVGADPPMTPRVQILSSGYALNAASLDGKEPEAFLKSDGSDQFTGGELRISPSSTLTVNGTLDVQGSMNKATTSLVPNLNADLLDGRHSTQFLSNDFSNSFTNGTLTFLPGTSVSIQGTMYKSTTDLVSNLNADMLDGQQAADFSLTGHEHDGGEITGTVDEAVNADTVDGKHASGFIDTSATAQTKAGDLSVQDLTIEDGDLLFGNGGRISNNSATGTGIFGGDSIGDNLFLNAGANATGGSITLWGNGSINFRAGGSTYQFLENSNPSQPTVTASLGATGDLQIDGDLTVDGDDVTFGAGSQITSAATSLTISSGESDGDDLILHAGNSTDDGFIRVLGDNRIRFGAGNGIFVFENPSGDPVTTLEIEPDSRIHTDLGAFYLMAGERDTYDLWLQAGDSQDDGLIHIRGDEEMELHAGDGTFEFYNASTSTEIAELREYGDLQIDGHLIFKETTDVYVDIRNAADILFYKDYDNDTDGSYFAFFTNGQTVEQLRIYDGDEADADFDGAVNANGIDYAEAFKIIDPTLEAGDVVMLLHDLPEHIARSAESYGASVIGVISEKPGFVTGNSFNAEEEADPEIAALRDRARAEGDFTTAKEYTTQLVEKKRAGQRPVALMGRVPVKVDGSHGAIAPGDYLTSSPTPGHAMRMDRPGPSIGIALEAWDNPGRGKVLAFISRGHYTPPEELETVERELSAQLDERTPDPTTGMQSMSGHLQVVLDRNADDEARFSIFRDGEQGLGAEVFRVDEQGNVYTKGAVYPASMDVAEYFPLSEPAEEGDLLVVDREAAGRYALARSVADPAVVGIVSGRPGVLLGTGIERIAASDVELAEQLEEARAAGNTEAEARIWKELERTFRERHAPVALTGTVMCKVDAGYGAIRAGDLLTSSPTAGHAMLASDPTLPGTVVGKALEALDSGTGRIRVLVMMR